MIKLFVSYRSLDSVKVDALVHRLRSLKDPQNQLRFAIWQDKYSIPDGQDWWEAIVNAIIDSRVFVFMVSRESVQNANCRAELSYAAKRNRPILPLVLEGEFAYNPVTGKNDIDYWNEIPEELNDLRAQFLFYEGTAWLQRVERAIAEFEREPQRWRDIPAPKPRDPRDASAANNNTAALYNEACDYAWRLEIPTAERLFQKLIRLNDPIFAEDAHEWILLLREYQTLLNLDASDNTRYKISPLWKKYVDQFPKPFTPLFDPKGFLTRYTNPLPAVSPFPPMTAEDYYLRGVAYSRKGDYTGAINDLQDAIRLNPDFAMKPDLAEACFKRGYASRLKGNHDAAIADYSQAIRLKPDLAEAFYGRGISRTAKGELDGAITDFTEAIRLKPDYATAYYNRGNARYNKGNVIGAMADYTEVIRLKPTDATAYYNRGNARKSRGDFDGAIADHTEAIRLKPDFAEAFNNRGVARRDKGDYAGAIADYSEAIRLKPEYVNAYNNRGAIYLYEQKAPDRAIQDFETALAIKPDDVHTLTNLDAARKAK